MSLMPSFCSCEAEGVSSLSLMPQIQRIMARSLWLSRHSSDSFGPNVSLPWSIAERTQALYTLPRILGERCLVVRTGKSFLNFALATPHLAAIAIALSQPPPEYSISLKISLKFVPKVRINNIPALVQIMAWRRPGDKPLSEPMMVSLLTHICVTRPQ